MKRPTLVANAKISIHLFGRVRYHIGFIEGVLRSGKGTKKQNMSILVEPSAQERNGREGHWGT